MADKATPAFRFIQGLVLPFMVMSTKRDWKGLEHIPAEGPCILAPNHNSDFDPLAVGHFVVVGARRTPHFLGKTEVVDMPILGRLFKAAGQISVYRGTASAVNAFRDAIAALERGECIAVYPEGTTTKDPELWPMMGKTGPARMALETGAPVIPIAQWGAHRVIPNQGFGFHLFPRKTMHVHAGAPIDLDDLRGREVTTAMLEEATERIMQSITMLLAEIRGEIPPAERYNLRRRRDQS
ncbi:MAG: lysophospholipid acyltransferase family protein [Candidatus Nanopelagicales bacterium]